MNILLEEEEEEVEVDQVRGGIIGIYNIVFTDVYVDVVFYFVDRVIQNQVEVDVEVVTVR